MPTGWRENGLQAHGDRLRELVKAHRRIEDEPLLLAIAYDPARQNEEGHLYVFEVLENFGGNEVDSDEDLFEVTYGSTELLPLDQGQELHLILTNPAELRHAVKDGWPLAKELISSIERGDYEVLFASEEARDVQGRLGLPND